MWKQNVKKDSEGIRNDHRKNGKVWKTLPDVNGRREYFSGVCNGLWAQVSAEDEQRDSLYYSLQLLSASRSPLQAIAWFGRKWSL